MPASTAVLDQVTLVGAARKLNLLEAVTGDVTMTRTIDGASTVAIPVADHRRKLLRSPIIDERSWVTVAGINFELVKIGKSGDLLTLTFEDAIAAAMRRKVDALSIPAGAQTRAAILRRLARNSRVPALIDPGQSRKVAEAVRRGKGKDKVNDWDLAGQVAEKLRWRRFSDGKQLVAGSDEWLINRLNPIKLDENTGAVPGSIDFDLDVGKRASEASLSVHTDVLTVPPGVPVQLPEDMGPAAGKWLVAEVARPLSRIEATLKLTRPKHSLKEPKPKPKPDPGDPGEKDFVPGQGGTAPGGTAANAGRERMVQFALAQAGDGYTWGGNGPSSWDCSGLVQAATAAGGRTLGKPAASQWGRCVDERKTISVSAALGIRGALLFRIGGEFNHVAISLGNGTTIEAKGTAYGTGVFGNAASGGWTGAALWL